MRRAQHDKVVAPNLSPCPNCSEFMVPHRVCPSCGYYKGAAVTPAPKALGSGGRRHARRPLPAPTYPPSRARRGARAHPGGAHVYVRAQRA
ncbi:MAG: 50S ribosomal protein L32 [Polyangiaceae bacterium]|nr:50S ribosomal protein L32 [Polyangiaceae bacterium]